MRSAVVLLVLLAGCAGALPRPTDADAQAAATRWPGTTVADLAEGRRLYVARCSSCHTLYLPARFPSTYWHEMVDEMAARAKLTPPDQERVLRYLTSFAKDSPRLKAAR